MSEFNLPMPMKVKDDDDYLDLPPPHDDPYDDDLNPNNVSAWMDPRDDGGGKLRLKRRRRCGQCGPCQVKENCGKCQYCVRKDVLKQACIYRKCIYLRKPVPRFRNMPGSDKPEASLSSPGSSSSLGLPQAGPSKDPSKPAPNVNICALGQSQLAAREALSRQMEQLSHLSDNGRPNSDELMFRNSQPTMNPYRLSADQLNALSCAFPRPSWAHSGMNMNMAEAAAFHHNALGQPVLSRPSSVPSAGPTIPSPPSLSASSSCRLAMPDPACRYPVPSQPAFHPHMAFNTDWRSASSLTPSPAMGQSVTPPFYPPPHLSTSLPGFHGLNQFTSNSCPGSSFTGPRFPPSQTPMYPGSFYPPFRPNEPHIYHAQFPGPEMAFSELNRDGMYFFPCSWTYDKMEEDEDDLKKNSNFFPISKRMAEECRTIFEKYLKAHYSQPKVCLDSTKSVSDKMPGKLRMLTESEESLQSESLVPMIDEDLRRQLGSSGRRVTCGVSAGDFLMHDNLRSDDGFNNLDVEVDSSPVTCGCDSDFSRQGRPAVDSSLGKQTGPSEAASDAQEDTAVEVPIRNRPGQTGSVSVGVGQGPVVSENSMEVEVSGHALEEKSIQKSDPLLQQSSDAFGLLADLRSRPPPGLGAEERELSETEEERKGDGVDEKDDDVERDDRDVAS